MTGVVEVHGLAAEALDLLELLLERPGGDRPAAAGLLEADGTRLDSHELADERSEVGHRAACLSAHDRLERGTLFLVRALVDDEADLPIALDHVAWRAADHDELEPVELGAVEAAAIDVERHGEDAVAVRRLLEPAGRAGAQEVAVAGLHVASGNVPGHGVLLLGRRSRSDLPWSLSMDRRLLKIPSPPRPGTAGPAPA